MEAVSNVITSTPAGALLERRSHPRFEVQEGAIASLHLTVVGQIMNISANGLAFRYVARRNRSMESSTMHISRTDRTFNLAVIPVKILRDMAMPGNFSSDGITLRVCCVEFGDLQDYQIVALQYFIRKYTKCHC